MSVIVGPSQRVCSRPTLVSTATGAARTFVASWRPPSPASTTATSTPRSASSENAAAVSSSNCVTRSPPVSVRSTLTAAAAARSTAAPNASGSRSASPMRMRSAKVERWGDKYAPVRRPWASRIAAAIRTVELLPFVPTTWIARNARCGLPRAVSRRRIRSSPNFIPNSSRERRWSSACSRVQLNDRRSGPGRARGSFQRLQLRLQALELVALGLYHRRRRLGDEALVGELALGARDLPLEPLALARRSLRLRLGVDGVRGEHGDVAAGDRDGGDPSGAVLGPLDTGQPRDGLRSALVALGFEPRLERAAGAAPTRSRQARSSWTAPITRASSASAAASISDSSGVGHGPAISSSSVPG